MSYKVYEFRFGIDIIKDGPELILRKNGKEICSFNEDNDMYAYTNARDFAKRLELEVEKDSNAESPK